MSNRERCIEIIDSFTDVQLASIANLLQAAREAIAEAADDAFCKALYEDYKADPDKGQAVSLEDAAAMLGVSL